MGEKEEELYVEIKWNRIKQVVQETMTQGMIGYYRGISLMGTAYNV